MTRYIEANALKQLRADVISGKLDIKNEGDLIDACPAADVVPKSEIVDRDNKLKNQREEIRRLRKRLSDVAQSRDHWKREAKRIGKQLSETLNINGG
jgi:hypothetical protein